MNGKKPQNGIRTETDSALKVLTVRTNTVYESLILGFFFLSGMTGLMYEILWTRFIVKIIGGAPYAVSIVMTIFMGGLGLGSYIVGRYIDRIERPGNLVRLYGILEILIGVYGLLLPILLTAFYPVFSLLYNTLFSHFFVYNILTFIGCSLLLLLPASFMGATLPVLSRFYAVNMSHLGSRLGRLYGFNTFGAVTGSFLCGFIIINLWGVNGALIYAVILNIVIGVSSLLVSGRLNTTRTTVVQPRDLSDATATNTTLYGILIVRGALVIFAVSGFCAMAYEVIWIKLLGLIVGPTMYSFTVVLITFISGLAIGSLFFGWLGDITKRPASILAITQIAAALSVLIVSQILGNSQIFFAKLINTFKGSFIELTMLKSMLLFGFMFFPTFFLGATFPLVGKIYTKSTASVGQSVGYAYAMNTAGALLGTFCAGFLFIPFLGKENSLSFLIGSQLAVAIGFGGIVLWKGEKPLRSWIPVLLPAVIGILCAFAYPNWDREMLSYGKYHRFDVEEFNETGWLKSLLYGNELFEKYKSGEFVYFGDGVGGFTTVRMDTDILGKTNFSLMNSGKPDASTVTGDMGTQTLLAHFPMMFHPDPDTVLVLGLASGITAGEVLHYPVRKLDVLDINSNVVEACKFFTPWNNNLLNDPRTELIIQDGRAHLGLTKRSYDVVISEPSNPWMAGLATLFTHEFFGMVRDRLNDGGIFCQWIHAYQIDWENFALVGRTFADVFPNSLIVRTDLSEFCPDYLLIGFKGENGTSLETARRNMQYIKKSTNVKVSSPELLFFLIANEDLNHLFGEGEINTDNHPHLEFEAPKLMHEFDLKIQENFLAKKWLSPGTERILEDIIKTADRLIDLQEYFLSFEMTNQIMVDYSHAGQAEQERYEQVVKTYCGNTYVMDFSFIQDPDLRNECIMIQIEFMNDMLTGNGDRGSILFHIGELYYKLGMLDEAVSFYSAALDINSDDDVVHYNLGKILSLQGRYDEAIIHYQEALRLNPDHYYAMNNYGNILLKKGDIAGAVDLFRSAIEIDRKFALAHKNLGAVLKSIGKTEEGEAYYQEGLRLEQKSATLYR